MFIAEAAVITVYCLVADSVHCWGGGNYSFTALLLAVFIAGSAVITVLLLSWLFHCCGGGNHSFAALLLAVFIAGAAVIAVLLLCCWLCSLLGRR